MLGGPDGQAAEPSPGSSGDRREQRGPAFIYIYIFFLLCNLLIFIFNKIINVHS